MSRLLMLWRCYPNNCKKDAYHLPLLYGAIFQITPQPVY
jgi:hypothetical protein